MFVFHGRVVSFHYNQNISQKTVSPFSPKSQSPFLALFPSHAAGFITFNSDELNYQSQQGHSDLFSPRENC